MPRVKNVPTSAEENFKPSAEIHWGRVRWHPNIAEIARAVTGRNIYASAKRYREVGEIPTYSNALLVPFPCGSVASRILISELEALVNVLAHGLRPRPTAVDVIKHGPSMVRQFLRVAIPAAEQIHECVVGKSLNRPLLGIGSDPIRFAGVGDYEFATEP
jgi:hypothetical protein